MARRGRRDLNAKVALLLDATRRERDLTVQRSSATQTRASLLVGAAGLGAGSEAISGDFTWVTLVAFGSAALLGVAALFPDAMTSVRAKQIWDRQIEYSAIDVHIQVLEDELRADELAAKLVRRRSILVVVGFALFTVGVAAATANALDGFLHPDPPAPVRVEIVE